MNLGLIARGSTRAAEGRQDRGGTDAHPIGDQLVSRAPWADRRGRWVETVWRNMDRQS